MAKAKSKSNHGGKRTGSGRPAKFDAPMKRYTVRLADEHAAIATKLGEGDLATGIRHALTTAGKKVSS